MGLENRTYWRDGGSGGHRGGFGGGGFGGGGGGMRMGFPRPTPMIMRIMIVCGVVWLAQLIVGAVTKQNLLSEYFGATAAGWWQVWRLVTFQFLHSTSIWHIAMNMIVLYFFGMPLEQRWGPRRFLRFYLICGVAAGLAYVLMSWLLLPASMLTVPLIGASGGVYAVLLACAVLFPRMKVLVFFIFPVPIRILAAIIFGGMGLVILTTLNSGNVMTSGDFWSQVAHMGGAVAAAVWLWGLPKLDQVAGEVRDQARQGAWRRKMRKQQDEQAEIDRILEKIKHEGIDSLTDRDKRTLQQATERQRNEDQRINRM